MDAFEAPSFFCKFNALILSFFNLFEIMEKMLNDFIFINSRCTYYKCTYYICTRKLQ